MSGIIEEMFSGCAKLKKGSVHASITSIVGDAFSDCKKGSLVGDEGSYANKKEQNNHLECTHLRAPSDTSALI